MSASSPVDSDSAASPASPSSCRFREKSGYSLFSAFSLHLSFSMTHPPSPLPLLLLYFCCDLGINIGLSTVILTFAPFSRARMSLSSEPSAHPQQSGEGVRGVSQSVLFASHVVAPLTQCPAPPSPRPSRSRPRTSRHIFCSRSPLYPAS